MKKSYICFGLFLLFQFAMISQQVPETNSLEGKYQQYFGLPRENIYVHLNKEVLVPGERLWFKGYVLNEKTELPRREDFNVHVGLYDGNGNLKSSAMVYSTEGSFEGNMAIDSTMANGVHYFTASTNWMRNFGEDNTHVRAVHIVSEDFSFDMAESGRKELDIQFLPEGGDMVMGISNMVGFKVLDGNGYGQPVGNISVYDDQGSLISSGASNNMGMGKFELFPQPGRSYRAVVGQGSVAESSHALPMAKPLGVNLSVKNSPYHDDVRVLVQTNAATLAQRGGAYRLLVHRNGEMLSYDITLDNESSSQTLSIDKYDLAHGVNIFTLVDDNENPIEERLAFINHEGVSADVELSLLSMEKDSLQIKIMSGELEDADLSVSVLPAGTMAYSGGRSIEETFLLRPFLKGHIENAAYYFEDTNPKKEVELDELLLTQGWSRYGWNDILNNPPEARYRAEKGLALVGMVNGKVPDSLLLHRSANHGSQYISFEEGNNTFLLTGFFPQKGEELSFSAVGRGGRLSAPKMSLSMDGNSFQGFKKNYIQNSSRPFWYEDPTSPLSLRTPTDFVFDDKVVRLDNVTVTEERYEEYLDKAKSNIRIPAYIKNRISAVTPKIAWETPNILDFIRRRGYEVWETPGQVLIRTRRFNDLLDRSSVNVILDDVELQDLSILTQIPMAQIESYWFDRLSRYQGARSNLKETIYFYTATGKELDITPGEDFIDFKRVFTTKVYNGFEAPLEFYLPKYSTFIGELFSNFGAVHWDSGLHIDDKGESSIKILDTGLNRLKIFIEGMAKDGTLISTTKEIEVKRNL